LQTDTVCRWRSKILYVLAGSIILLAISPGGVLSSSPSPANSPWGKEIVYQIFERSFYDSNGDRIGDFKGIEDKLTYISRLGATAILLQPIFKSRVYHNYFADTFFEADPSLGGNREFFAMIRKAHTFHIKVILDMEIQYVASDHPWYKLGAPRILPKSGYLGMGELSSYTGAKIKIATVNLHDPQDVAEIHKCFKFWAGPNGHPSDGVDGFRIDHMMDDLDNAHLDTNLLRGFWAPLENDLRKYKPGVFFVAEQADWASVGQEQFGAGGVDAVYGIQLRAALLKAISSGDVKDLAQSLNYEQRATPPGKTDLTVIEDHDVQRFASLVAGDPDLLRLGAVFQMCVRGTPSIYYGQELGMRGTQLHGHDDGNDIPVRLAMRWKASPNANGEADWYGPGPWTRSKDSQKNASLSVEAETRDPQSLLNFYRMLIMLRERSSALTEGAQEVISSGNSHVLIVQRRESNQSVLGILNFSRETQVVQVGELGRHSVFLFLTGEKWKNSQEVRLIGHGFQILSWNSSGGS
jgi:alpha-amylase